MLRPRMAPYLLKFKNRISIYQNIVSICVIAGAIYKKIITKGLRGVLASLASIIGFDFKREILLQRLNFKDEFNSLININ